MSAPDAAAGLAAEAGSSAARGAGAGARVGVGAATGPIMWPAFAWFLAVDVVLFAIAHIPHGSLGFDAQAYSAAAAAWLSGGDPWSVTTNGIRVIAPPTTLVLYAPTAFVDPVAARLVWVGVSGAAAIAAVRLLRLHPGWLLFPPLATVVWAGSSETVVLLAVAAGARWAAPFVKVYSGAAAVAERDWRGLLLAGALVAATLPFLPWPEYVAAWRDLGAVRSTQIQATSAWGEPVLGTLTLIALATLGWRDGWYLAVPALWPGAPSHYAVFALAILARRPMAAMLIAVPWVPFVSALGVLAEACVAPARSLVRRSFGTNRAWRGSARCRRSDRTRCTPR